MDKNRLQRIQVAPRDGITVLDENSNIIKPGQIVNKTSFVSRLIKDGDLFEVEEATQEEYPINTDRKVIPSEPYYPEEVE